jgi:hypothetical protein
MGTDLHTAFEWLVADEPAMTLSVEPILAVGNRRARRRRVAVTTATLGVTGLAVAVAVPVLTAEQPAHARADIAPAAVVLPGLEQADPQSPVIRAITSASPTGWTFDFPAIDGPGAEGTADDGAGPGRISVGVVTQPGNLQVHPCRDPEFAAGVRCSERALDDGSFLSLRSTTRWERQEWMAVVLSRPDGTGVMAESGNFTLPTDVPAVVSSAEEKKRVTAVTVRRPHPTYALDQLAAVVISVDRATR